jgi:hypothetical protein
MSEMEFVCIPRLLERSDRDDGVSIAIPRGASCEVVGKGRAAESGAAHHRGRSKILRLSVQPESSRNQKM